jgi:hypothetical protein
MKFTNDMLHDIIVNYTSEAFWSSAGPVTGAKAVALKLFQESECCNPDRHDSHILRWALNRLDADGQWPYDIELYS